MGRRALTLAQRRALLIAGAVGGAVLIGLIAALVIILARARSEIVEQNARTRQLIELTSPAARRAPPVLDAARPLIASLRDGLPRVRRDAHEARDLIRSASPLVDDADRALTTVDGALPVLVDLATDAAPALQKLVPVLDSASGLLGEVDDRSLLRRASGAITTLGRVAALQRSAVQINRQSLSIQRETLSELKRSVEIQRELLIRTRSIDDKTLGTSPSANGPTP